jgi:hypothetical protein
VHSGRNPLGDRHTTAAELLGLVRVVAQQPGPVGAQREQHLGGRGVVPLILAPSERQVRLVRVQPSLLQRVRVQLGVQADAAALLAQIEQEPPGVGDAFHRLAQLRPAVAALAAEHVAGQAFAMRPHQRRPAAGRRLHQRPPPVAEAERDVFPAVDQPVERQHTGSGRIPVGEAQRHGDLAPDRRRREHLAQRL